jgi:hypothetical protein
MTLEVKQMHQQRSENYEVTLEKFKCNRMVLIHTGCFLYCTLAIREIKYSTVDKYTATRIRFIYSQKGNCALVPNSYIHVSVSCLYIPTIGAVQLFCCSK